MKGDFLKHVGGKTAVSAKNPGEDFERRMAAPKTVELAIRGAGDRTWLNSASALFSLSRKVRMMALLHGFGKEGLLISFPASPAPPTLPYLEYDQN